MRWAVGLTLVVTTACVGPYDEGVRQHVRHEINSMEAERAAEEAVRQQVPEANLATPHPLAALITGSEASMTRFEAAARACGAETFSIDQGAEPRWVGIGRGLEAPYDDPHILCAMQWISDHRDEELYFVGNAPRE